jgi:hypothetical protein
MKKINTFKGQKVQNKTEFEIQQQYGPVIYPFLFASYKISDQCIMHISHDHTDVGLQILLHLFDPLIGNMTHFIFEPTSAQPTHQKILVLNQH